MTSMSLTVKACCVCRRAELFEVMAFLISLFLDEQSNRLFGDELLSRVNFEHVDSSSPSFNHNEEINYE